MVVVVGESFCSEPGIIRAIIQTLLPFAILIYELGLI